MPISLSSFLIPTNGNEFFLIEDTYVKGGFQVVEDVALRDNIPAINRKSGMLVFDANTETLYRLNVDKQTWTEVDLRSSTFAYVADISADWDMNLQRGHQVFNLYSNGVTNSVAQGSVYGGRETEIGLGTTEFELYAPGTYEVRVNARFEIRGEELDVDTNALLHDGRLVLTMAVGGNVRRYINADGHDVGPDLTEYVGQSGVQYVELTGQFDIYPGSAQDFYGGVPGVLRSFLIGAECPSNGGVRMVALTVEIRRSRTDCAIVAIPV